MKKINRFLLIVLFPIKIFAQEPVRVLIKSGEVSEMKQEIYAPPYLAKPIYKSQNEALNTSIEGLMSSILSENTQAWVNKNTLGGVNNAEQKKFDDFAKIESYKKNPDKNYFELISKLSFSSLGENFMVIKFKIHLEQIKKPVSGAYLLQNVAGKWYKTSRSDFSNLTLLIIFFKPIIFNQLLVGTPTDNTLTDEIMKSVRDEKGLNIKKLYKEFSTWEKDKIKMAHFLEPSNW